MANHQLIDHIRAHSSPLDPVETGEPKLVSKVPGLKAVVFDVYGTLFISASGDISLAENEDRSPAIMAALETAGYEVLDREAPWSANFMGTLQRFRRDRAKAGIDYPEVHIEEVWQDLIEESKNAGFLAGSGDVQLAIVDHECRVNPCWPMPNLEETLSRLTREGLHLGIVSNAQFYTPLLFPALISKPHTEYAFDSKHCVWSWMEREGKPSTGLYQRLKQVLEVDGISPHDTLYVGNDLRNDIWPAKALGFQTVLFAGDKRSLRWRTDDPDCRSVRPDFVITDLSQLFEIL
ncbi:HAD family hydrolase [Puniceicoccales bacterium CK1056]|uniref:HAD family hydrolase n=1 Tax=Oceanipulchritudo coccoides TaxID=2706888 RepID=A0A6B2LYP5_9BACT|nr:HAD family hydrolase [Oceanipulchritudo coccoides]NDV61811.1 HAD family hydrolase [Oceanipulchritudo coccoides]